MHRSHLARISMVTLLIALLLSLSTHLGIVTALPAQGSATPSPTLTDSAPPSEATLYPPCPPEDDTIFPTETSTAIPTRQPTVTGTLRPTATVTAAPTDFSPGYLGLAGETVAPSNCGTLVVAVEEGSPAQEAGILVGDIIVAVDNQPRRGLDALRAYILRRSPGDTVIIVLKRDAEELTFRVQLGERPRRTPLTATPPATP
ncbi:MAG: hypothetical protein OHK0023_10030 [Anaerolineae bacterium]